MGRGWTHGAVLLASVAAGLGCGGSDSSDDEARIREAVDGFYVALQRKNGGRACAALTARARRDTQSIATPRRPCEAAIVGLFGGDPPPRIGKVEIDGNEATVELLQGEGGNATLIKDDGSWLIDAF